MKGRKGNLDIADEHWLVERYGGVYVRGGINGKGVMS
jgi:hypothetical protein